MAEKLYYCDTCNVHLSGPQPAIQHYNGSKHKKKEALAKSNTLFPAADDSSPSQCMNYSTLRSLSGLDGQLSSLKLPGLVSAASGNWMESGNTLKSVEAGRTCSVVMVPSLNPDLPPVPVTVTENVLPATEYELHGDSGSCYLCDVEFTSEQHANQHLSGQKHLKAKKRWEEKREQLQMTVSGLCPSMKSKPIAMCQPLVCEVPAKNSISDIVAKYNSNRPAPPPPSASAAESTSFVDGPQQWFTCEVCKKKMNTVEMLDLHKQSVAHLKKVQQQQPGAVFGDNTVWLSCPACQKKLNSPAQLEIHMTNHSRPSTTLSDYTPDCPAERGTTPTLATSVAQFHHCDICNKYMNTALQLELHQQSPAHQKKVSFNASGNNGDNTVWQICPVCSKRLNSLKQLDIHMSSHRGISERSLLNDLPRDNTDNVYKGTETQLMSTAVTGEMIKNLKARISETGKLSAAVDFGEKEDVKNLLKPVDELQLKERSSQDDDRVSESLTRRESAARNWPNTTETCQFNSANQTAGQAAAVADYADDKEAADSVVTSENQLRAVMLDNKTQQNSNNATSPAASEAGVVCTSTAAAPADDGDAERLVADDDLITTGCCSDTCVYHCELCDVHLNGDEPRNMHLTGAKHISCRQKAAETLSSEHNPFSPNFRYCCQLCNVPFNTLRDKKCHERGQQHTSKSVRFMRAPDRQLPDVVLPTDAVENINHAPASLVTSTPRSYQEELYFKSLVADSICFLPTGIGLVY